VYLPDSIVASQIRPTSNVHLLVSVNVIPRVLLVLAAVIAALVYPLGIIEIYEVFVVQALHVAGAVRNKSA